MAKKKKKSSIGANPLDAVVPSRRKSTSRASVKVKTSTPSEAPPEKVEKERVTIHVTSALIDKVRDAVYWTPGLTVASFAEDALSKALEGLAKKNGKPFPPRKGELKSGRPVKS